MDSRLLSPRCLAVFAILLGVAGGTGCAETRDAVEDGGARADAAIPDAGGVDHDAAAGAGADSGASDGGGLSCEPPELNREPGPALYERAARGTVQCASTTLGAVIDAVHAARPDLVDIQDLYVPDPERGGDQSFIYAFATHQGGFALVFRRGAGDCPAGCTENWYYYFRTDESCEPQAIGSYVPTYASGGCVEVEGFPMWDHPPPFDPRSVCEAARAARGVGGDHEAPACGQRMPCSTKGGTEAPIEALAIDLQYQIEQDADDPSRAMLTLLNTGHPALDGRALQATVERRRVHVFEQVDNLPAVCAESHELEVVIDFEGYSPSFVHYFETKTPDCDGAPGDLCKGGLGLDLGNLAAGRCLAVDELEALMAREQALHGHCEEDADCALVAWNWAGSCNGACPSGIRADHAEALEQLIRRASDAYCPDSGCSLDSDCSLYEPACRDGRCRP